MTSRNSTNELGQLSQGDILVVTVDFDGSLVSYTGLEPIFDNTTAANRVFTVSNAGNHQVRVANDTTTAGRSLVESTGGPGFETVRFNNPTASLVVNSGNGNDTVTIEPMDGAFTASLTVNGQDGNDTVNGGAGDDYVYGDAGDDILDGGCTRAFAIKGGFTSQRRYALENGVLCRIGQ